jgi:hypothetical protein
MASLVSVTNATTWADFWYLFKHSRLVNVMVIDLLFQHILACVFVGKDSSLRQYNADTLIHRRRQQLQEQHGDNHVGSTVPHSLKGWLQSLRQYTSSKSAVHLQLGLLELAVIFLPMLGAQMYLLLRPIAAAGGVLPLAVNKRLRVSPAAAPAGTEEITEAEGLEEVLGEIGLKAKGLLHRVTAARRSLGDVVLSAMHAVFPEGTLVRRRAQETKRVLKRVLSRVFQGVAVEYERRPVRQYSVEHNFNSTNDEEEEQHHEDAAPAGENGVPLHEQYDDQELPGSQIGKFLRRRGGNFQVGASSQIFGAGEPVMLTPAQQVPSVGRQVGRAGPALSPAGTPAGSVSTRGLRAAKEAAKRSIAAIAAGEDVTSMRGE